MLISKTVKLELKHPVDDEEYRLKIIGKNSSKSLMIEQSQKASFCSKEVRVCSLEYRPHRCSIELREQLISSEGANQCGARWAAVDKVCDLGLSHLLNDPSEIECKQSKQVSTLGTFAVSKLFKISSLIRGSSFDAVWDGRNLKISHSNFMGKSSVEDRTSDIGLIVEALNAIKLPEAESEGCMQDQSAGYDGAYYISIQSEDYRCSGQKAFDLLYDAMVNP
ncbi:MAG: hypothetical protein HRU09_14970 [Oligoflexales bacterium]|nr:hypothetical protein [Oligoflexales bacterium]